MKKLCYIVCLVFAVMSCSDDESKNTGTIVFEFDARAGLEDDFETGVTYENALGQEFNLSTLKYTIKDVRLKRANGTYVSDPADAEYDIDEASEEGTLVTLNNIPAGNYTAIEFTIGGDEAYMQLLGTSPESEEAGKKIQYEISSLSNQKVMTIEFHDHIATVSGTTEPEVHLIIDVLKFFTGSTDIDFTELPVCTEEACGANIVDNYSEAFVFDHIHS